MNTAAWQALKTQLAITDDEPAPMPPPAPPPGPGTGAEIDLYQPFQQTVWCAQGYKPYYNPDTSGDWTVSWNGDDLAFAHPSGAYPGQLAAYGTRFSTSGSAINRSDYPQAAMLQTCWGCAGSVWFTRHIHGVLLSAGHNNIGCYHSAGYYEVLECADAAQSGWIHKIAENPFFTISGNLLRWETGEVSVSCFDSDLSDQPFSATISTTKDGPTTVRRDDVGDVIMLLDPSDPFASEYSRYGVTMGASPIWYLGDAAPDLGSWLYWVGYSTVNDNRLLSLTYERNRSGETGRTRCVPYGLDPR